MKGFKKLSTWKKFLISLLATTVSIVLTFGTTAIIDRKKQNAEKREMVLMVMYDMRESMEECEQCQKELKAFCDVQVDLVAHPEKFSGGFAQLMVHVPFLNYITTTENIFKSNIETIRTIGNILLVETVSAFYTVREKYKSEVVESILGASRAEVTGKVVDEHHQREADLQRAWEEGRKALGQDGVV